jgi:hypothetical protein
MEIDTSPTATDTLVEGEAAAAAVLAILGTSVAKATADAGQSDAWVTVLPPRTTDATHTCGCSVVLCIVLCRCPAGGSWWATHG